jgi:geranylgeranyl reductase family protein
VIYDVLIAGAGPAGSALAAILADRGYSVLLVDAAAFPRDKLCGEFVGPGCRSILDELGVLGEVKEAGRPVRGMQVVSMSGAALAARYPGMEAGFAVRRSVLDHLLLRNALSKGIEFHEGFRVENLLLEDGVVRGVRGRSRGEDAPNEFRARLTVGSDGRNSVVSRRLGLLRRHRRHRRTALCVHYRDVERPGDCAEVFLGSDCYGILNPLRDGTANVCLVVEEREVARELRSGHERSQPETGAACFRYFLGQLPRLAERLGDASHIEAVRLLGPLAQRAVRCSWSGALVVGDAAGFYDPFTGEGVYMALRGAQLAGLVIGQALAAGDASAGFLARYDAARGELDARYRLEALVQQIILRPRLADFTVARLAGAGRAAGSLMGVLGGLLAPGHLCTLRFVGSFLFGDRPV